MRTNTVIAFFAIALLLAACQSTTPIADTPTAISTLSQPATTLFPTFTPSLIPSASPTQQDPWQIADQNPASDWLVYATPYLGSLVLDDKYIWAGGSGGLLRWDQETGDVLQFLAPQTRLPDNSINNLILRDDLLYISTDTAIAIFDRRDKWTVFTNKEMGLGKGSGNILAVAEDGLWIANKTGLAHQTLDGKWQTIPASAKSFRLEFISTVIVQPDGIYIEGTEQLGDREHVTYRFANGQWDRLDYNFPTYLQDPNGTLWKSDRKQVLYSKDGGTTWQPAFEYQDFIKPLAFDKSGRLYLTSESGILVYAENQLVQKYWFTDIGPELNYINIIRVDQDGQIWFATDGRGLTMFDGQRWRNWQPTTRPDMRHEAIRGLAVTHEYVFASGSSAAGEGGAMILDIHGDQWNNYWPGESELSGGGVDGLAVNSQGQVYFPTAAGILDIYDKGQWQHINMPPTGNRMLITTEGLFDPDGNYWVGTDGFGLWKYDGAQWEIYDINSGSLQSNIINALALDKQNQLWALTGNGLAAQCSNGRWKEFSIPTITDTILFGDIAFDSQNRVWVTANFDVLGIFNGENWQTFLPDAIGESFWDSAIAFDAQGRAWVSTSNGVAIFRGDLSLPAPQGTLSVCD